MASHVVTRLVAMLPPGRRVLVGVDGVDASGKTSLADALAVALAPQRPFVRASVDGFHRPRAERYRLGADSPEGCYRDTFDHQSLRGQLLEPFLRDGSYVSAVFDHLRDRAVETPAQRAALDAVLVVDGVFLQRPELDVGWDVMVHLRIQDDEVLRRAVGRDDGDPDEVVSRYRTRYLPAQRMYEDECRPAERAAVVLDNSDPQAPVVLRWG